MLRFKSKHIGNHFDVKYDESHSTNISVSTPVEKPNKLGIFKVRRKKGFENTFDVDFEDSATCGTDTTDSSLRPKSDIFKRKPSARSNHQQGSSTDDSFRVGKVNDAGKTSCSEKYDQEKNASMNVMTADSLMDMSQDDSSVSKSTPNDGGCVTPKITETNVPFNKKPPRESSFSIAYDDSSVRSELTDSPVSSQEPNSTLSSRRSSRILSQEENRRRSLGPFKRSMKRLRDGDSNIEYNVDEVQSSQESQCEESDFKKPKPFGSPKNCPGGELYVDKDVFTPSDARSHESQGPLEVEIGRCRPDTSGGRDYTEGLDAMSGVLMQASKVLPQELELTQRGNVTSQSFTCQTKDGEVDLDASINVSPPKCQESQALLSQESEASQRRSTRKLKDGDAGFDAMNDVLTPATQEPKACPLQESETSLRSQPFLKKMRDDPMDFDAVSDTLTPETLSQEENGSIQPSNGQERDGHRDFYAMSDVLTQESELTQRRPRPFSKRMKGDNADFDAMSDVLTPASQDSEALSQGQNRSLRLFKSRARKGHAGLDTMSDVFCMESDMSEGRNGSSQPFSSQESQEKVFKKPFTRIKKGAKTNFNVDFEESARGDNVTLSGGPVVSSQESVQGSSEEASRQVRKPSGFGGRVQKANSARFDVDFDESGNVTSLTQRSDLKTSTPIFRKAKKSVSDGDFSVNFEESRRTRNGSALTPSARLNETLASQFSSDMENLDGWMSDPSEEEDEETAVEPGRTETSSRRSVHEEAVMVTEEDKERWLAKAREIALRYTGKAGTESEMIKFKQLYCQTISSDSDNKRRPLVPKQAPGGWTTKKSERIVEKRSSSRRWKKPAPFATKRLYNHVLKNMRRRYGLDAVLRTEELIRNLCDVVKVVERRKGYQKKLVNQMKVELARSGLIETTYDFYDFVREYLPESFRWKVIPCVQPGTGITFPPKDGRNPLDKIIG